MVKLIRERIDCSRQDAPSGQVRPPAIPAPKRSIKEKTEYGVLDQVSELAQERISDG